MSAPRILRALLRALARVVPRRFHTRSMTAGRKVDSLSSEERKRLRENLEQIIRPKAA